MKKIKKLFFALIALVSFTFVMLAFVRLYQKTFSIQHFLETVIFFGFCFYISILTMLDKANIDFKNTKDYSKFNLYLTFLFLISLFAIFVLEELWLKLFGLIGLVLLTFAAIKSNKMRKELVKE